MTWKQDALAIIDPLYQEMRSTEPETVTNIEIVKRISRKHYPFSYKSGWPYKAWLSAIREYGTRVNGGQMTEIKGSLFE